MAARALAPCSWVMRLEKIKGEGSPKLRVFHHVFNVFPHFVHFFLRHPFSFPKKVQMRKLTDLTGVVYVVYTKISHFTVGPRKPTSPSQRIQNF